MKRMLIAFSALTLVLASCKKDEVTNKQVTPTKENLTGTWMITAATISGGGATFNVFNNADESANIFDACQRDDKYLLNADLSFAIQDAGTQCNPPGDATGTWDLTNSTTIDINGEAGTISSFDGKTLVVSETGSGVSQSVTYVKQ